MQPYGESQEKVHFMCSNPKCSTRLTVPSRYIGKRAKCPSCGTLTCVPAPSDRGHAATADPASPHGDSASSAPRQTAERSRNAYEVTLRWTSAGLTARQLQRAAGSGLPSRVFVSRTDGPHAQGGRTHPRADQAILYLLRGRQTSL